MKNADHRGLLGELTAAIHEGRSVATATIIETSGSVPRRAGSKMLVYADGSTSGTIGGGRMEVVVTEDALATIQAGETTMRTYELREPDRGDPGVCGGTLTIALEPFMPPHTVIVVGCGHVGKAVVDLAHWLDYRVIAVDDRTDLVTQEALPNADIRFAGTVADAMAEHPVTANTSIILVTRSNELDAQFLPLLLTTPAPYIGVMGSKRRWSTTLDLLREAGVSAGEADRVHVPIGIEIEAETVAEIAVSIMAEVIKVSAGNTS